MGRLLNVHHDRDIGVLEEGVHAERRLLRRDDDSGHRRASPRSEGQLGLAVVDGQMPQQQAAETGASDITDNVEGHETLEAAAAVRELTDAVEHQDDNLLTWCCDLGQRCLQQLPYRKSTARSGRTDGRCQDTRLVHDSWSQVDEDGTRDVLACTCL